MTATEQAVGQATCAVRPANLPRPNPVSVNGVAISRAAIAREVQNHPADKPVGAWLKAARALVVRELLLQEARRIGLTAEPLTDADGRREMDDEALVRALIEREVVTPEADEATCRRYFEQNRSKFRSADLYAVRHILCAAAPSDGEARAAAREHANAILARLAANPGEFDALAREHSACPSREMGGNLGQISSGQTVPEFEAALACLPVAEIPDAPIETRYGYHVVVIDRRIEGEDLPFEAVASRIAAWLAARARHTAIRQYITMLAGRAEISGIALEATGAPLVP
jgi:peptidyl-prolyl cis-trans isomerase C